MGCAFFLLVILFSLLLELWAITDKHEHRESGVTCWRTQDFSRARSLWESALSFSNFPFEYRLAIVSQPTYFTGFRHLTAIVAPQFGNYTCKRPGSGICFGIQARKRTEYAR